jgi:hypothetical protein
MPSIYALVFVLSGLLFQQPPGSEAAAFAKIGAEKNVETKKKLMLSFEKSFPKSNRLPELYMELSRTMIAQSDFGTATQYAEKAVAAVARMKSDAAASETSDGARQWLDAIDTSTKNNLAWVKQMGAWQDRQIRSTVLGKR